MTTCADKNCGKGCGFDAEEKEMPKVELTDEHVFEIMDNLGGESPEELVENSKRMRKLMGELSARTPEEALKIFKLIEPMIKNLVRIMVWYEKTSGIEVTCERHLDTQRLNQFFASSLILVDEFQKHFQDRLEAPAQQPDVPGAGA